MLVQIWTKGIIYLMFEGVQADSVTMEIRIELPHKLRDRFLIWSRCTTSFNSIFNFNNCRSGICLHHLGSRDWIQIIRFDENYFCPLTYSAISLFFLLFVCICEGSCVYMYLVLCTHMLSKCVHLCVHRWRLTSAFFLCHSQRTNPVLGRGAYCFS